MPPNELRVPPQVASQPDAREVLRVWISNGSQHFVLRADEWDDPAAWGLLLVDIARNAARAQAQRVGGTAESALERIRAGFDAEWEHPTD
jgi:hypothetical protein